MEQATYKVDMAFLANKDDYEQGYTGEYGASWEESAEFETLKEVKEFVKNRVYSGYEYIEYDSENKWYRTGYLATDENEGEMSKTESIQWKKGKINGWSVNVDITIKKFTPKIIGNVKFN